ncbi:MAG TPA: bifunctional UDP-N-acetylglucosamine diphosphorylase/glucosamine-1-phosphate N-acetyltransferase GlmU [Mariprofundaceae bacterium]|nr:bifunctional UDP-N-acetylglucosamine diphosphorylase/glucosamine-1-phosphate N-acetyltransferase GlmU [Mariprofundaceae bacterium]
MPHTLHYPDLLVCVLAAGKGKRMRSTTPKVLHPVLGKAMLLHVLHTVEELQPSGMVVVTGDGSDQVREHVGQPANLEWVIQDKQLGTGHAVRQCESVCQGARHIMIVCGDTPLLRVETLHQLAKAHMHSGAEVTFLSAIMDNPFGYGRVIRNAAGDIVAIAEERDASDEQKTIREVTSGIYCVKQDVLFKLLEKVGNTNAQGEYYLPDIVPLALEAGMRVQAVAMGDSREIRGINNRTQLAEAEAILQKRIAEDWQMNGVTIEQPETVRIEASVKIGTDTVIRAGTQLLGSTHIGDNCVIGPYAVLENAWIDDGCSIYAFSHINDASAGEGARIGPFARLRPGAKLDEDVHIGNFVEVKKSVIGRSSKINHLSYVGDALVGEQCNIGAGTITCNYDGANKHVTEIGDNVFVGSDTKLIAPVRVADNATIGAGSIITRDVAPGGLTLSARPDQRHVADWQRPTKKES